MSIENKFNEVFNIKVEENENGDKEVNYENKETALSTDTFNYENELKNRKKELGILLTKSQTILDIADEGAQEYGKPANIKAYSELLSSMTKLITEIKTIDNDMNNKKNLDNSKIDKIEQNNYYFNSRELIDFLEQNKK